MQDGALLSCIKSINKPDINNILSRQSIPVPITNIASLQLKAKVEGFSEQKAKGFKMTVSEMNTCVCWYWLLIWFGMCQIIWNIFWSTDKKKFHIPDGSQQLVAI